MLTNKPCLVQGRERWPWLHSEAFGLDPGSGSTGEHPLLPAEKWKPEILISCHYFLLLRNSAFLQGTQVPAVACEVLAGCWQCRQGPFYATISLLFKLMSKFQLSYLLFLGQVVCIAAQVPYRWWVWSFNMSFYNPDGIFSVVVLPLTLRGCYFISSQERENAVNLKCFHSCAL